MTSQETRIEVSAPPLSRAAPERDATWRHALQHWELWVAIAIGAFLRLWSLGASPWRDDQVGYMTLARSGVLHGAAPITGLPFSVGFMSSPLDIYLAMPFTFGGEHPVAATLSVAVWNVFGLAACYIFVLRSFDRRTAAVATLLLSTCAAAVDYSRYLWQLNYIAPLLALWAITLFAGGVFGSRRWLIPNVTLLALVALLHPTAALLVPVFLVALAFAPRKPSAREYVVAAVILVLLVLPNLVWEVISGGSDFSTLTHYGSKHATIDGTAVYRIYELLSGPITTLQPLKPPHNLSGTLRLLTNTPTSTLFSTHSAYAQLGMLTVIMGLIAFSLFVIGWIALAGRVVRPVRTAWREAAQVTVSAEGVSARTRAVWDTLRPDRSWRRDTLLWLCVTLPPLLTLRHTGPVYPHYLLITSPFIFVVSSIGACWLISAAGRAGARLRTPVIPRRRAATAFRYAVCGALAVFICAQTAQSALFVYSLAHGELDTSGSGYGYLLKDLQSADARLALLQSREGARSVFLTTTPATNAAISFGLVGERQDRISFDQNCLILPPASSGPALIGASYSAGADAQLLGALPNATHITNVTMPGTEPIVVYKVSGQTPLLADEIAAPPVTFTTPDGASLRLDAVSFTATHGLRARWTVLGDMRTSSGVTVLHTLARVLRADGSVTHPASFDDCGPQRWQAGETLFTWMEAPSTADGRALLFNLQTYTQGFDYLHAGPVPVVAGATVRSTTAEAQLSTSAEYIYHVAGVSPQEWYGVPLSAVGQ